MTFNKKLLNYLPEIFFFSVIFFLTILPLRDFDIWFHLKSGEIISKMGIIHVDVFSHSASGREWIPYEWLFQIGIYFFKSIFGFEAIKYLVAFVTTVQTIFIYLILKKVINLNRLLTFSLTFIYIISNYEFVTARPHILAYTFLVINLFLILFYYFKGKNLLILTVPVTLVWTNIHGSIFLDSAFLIGYSFISGINYYFSKQKEWLKKAKTLAIYGVITAFLTVLPPLGTLQYQLLWRFFLERNLITRYIDEWTPLNYNVVGFTIFTTTTILVLLPFIFLNFKQKSFKANLWVIPLLPFLVWPYLAIRNIFLGYITLTLITGWCLAQLDFFKFKKVVRLLLVGILILAVGGHIWLWNEKRQARVSFRFYYPVNAVEFIKKYDIQGNMFNEYGYGGYLLYHLYPKQKVLLDGRTDVYLCCEMPDTLEIANKKNLSDTEYKIFLDSIWDKYKISFVVLRTEKHTVLRKIMRILTDDSNWNLIFWDDHTQIFVKKDGKNDQLLSQFETKAATPYGRDPFREGTEDLAFKEYQRMLQLVDSAKSRNTIGFIYLKRNQIDKAKEQFEKAVLLDHTNESPYMNLAEIFAKDGDLDNAIKYYQRAKLLAPDRGLIYIRLGQLTLQKTQDMNQAVTIWQEGLKETVDADAKNTLTNLISNAD